MGSFQVLSCYLGESEGCFIKICGPTVVLNVLSNVRLIDRSRIDFARRLMGLTFYFLLTFRV